MVDLDDLLSCAEAEEDEERTRMRMRVTGRAGGVCLAVSIVRMKMSATRNRISIVCNTGRTLVALRDFLCLNENEDENSDDEDERGR